MSKEKAPEVEPPDLTRYVLRLYVSGMTPRSVHAIDTIRRLCEDRLCGRYQLEVLDIHQQAKMAQTDQIIALPTLVRRLPLPLRKLIGDMSDEQRVLVGLDIELRSDEENSAAR